MDNKFSGSDIIEIAIEIEKNGYDFYNTLAKNTKHQDREKLFDYLAEAEKEHINVFQDIFDSIQDKTQYLITEDYLAYMNSLASGHVFTQKNKGKQIAQKIKSLEQALGTAIDFEKQSILFFESIKKSVPEKDRHIIDELIKQEETHIAKLMDFPAKPSTGG